MTSTVWQRRRLWRRFDDDDDDDGREWKSICCSMRIVWKSRKAPLIRAYIGVWKGTSAFTTTVAVGSRLLFRRTPTKTITRNRRVSAGEQYPCVKDDNKSWNIYFRFEYSLRKKKSDTKIRTCGTVRANFFEDPSPTILFRSINRFVFVGQTTLRRFVRFICVERVADNFAILRRLLFPLEIRRKIIYTDTFVTNKLTHTGIIFN